MRGLAGVGVKPDRVTGFDRVFTSPWLGCNKNGPLNQHDVVAVGKEIRTKEQPSEQHAVIDETGNG
jgi:hypothetical protein